MLKSLQLASHQLLNHVPHNRHQLPGHVSHHHHQPLGPHERRLVQEAPVAPADRADLVRLADLAHLVGLAAQEEPADSFNTVRVLSLHFLPSLYATQQRHFGVDKDQSIKLLPKCAFCKRVVLIIL